jgi:hypothetical protein
VFLLLAENEGSMLETVRSRCAELPLKPSQSERSAGEDAVKFVRLALDGDRPGLLGCIFALERLDRLALGQALLDVKRAAALQLRSEQAPAAAKLIEAICEAEKYLSVSVSAGHICGLLLSRLM